MCFKTGIKNFQNRREKGLASFRLGGAKEETICEKLSRLHFTAMIIGFPHFQAFDL
jgi:hypothetical protein